MAFSPQLAERRFGFGPAPRSGAPASVTEMLARLAGPDRIAEALPQPPFSTLQQALVLRRRFRGYARKNPESAEGRKAAAREREIYGEARAAWFGALRRSYARRVETEAAFRERLVAFWGDHFTARGKGGLLRFAMPAYLEEAVRPRITGSFADLLIACVMHPLMLHYLDQDSSMGPNSILVRRRDLDRGLNENLAREVLELHTLGSGGPYGQEDVRQLAELFTGLSRTRDHSFVFRRIMAEPGPETVLGKTYGKGASPQYVEEVLRDLAAHPATADHLARKLAVHFLADDPPSDLVQDLAAAYRETGGQLMALYEVLLNHPAAWAPAPGKLRPPQEYLATALRALGMRAAEIEALPEQQVRRLIFRPLRLMGQPWQAPPGPDGWPEGDAAWITPQGIATRLEWAMTAPARLLQELPDPQVLLEQALGPAAGPELRFAVAAAEDRGSALGLVLSAPAFQRR